MRTVSSHPKIFPDADRCEVALVVDPLEALNIETDATPQRDAVSYGHEFVEGVGVVLA